MASVVYRGKVLDRSSSEYFILRRRSADLKRASPLEGAGATAALAAVSGETSRFLAIVDDLFAMPGGERELPYLILFSNCIGERRLSRRLLAEVDFRDPTDINRKMAVSASLFDLGRLQSSMELAERMQLPEEEWIIKRSDMQGQEQIMKLFSSIGIGMDGLDATLEVASKAALGAGVLLAVSPAFRYDVEDQFLSVSFEVPFDMDTIFAIEDAIDDLSSDWPEYPGRLVSLSFHMSDEQVEQ